MQELSRQISKLEAPERKFIDEAKRMFLDFGRQNSVGVEYNRVSNGYTYSTIQDDVIDAIKRHVKISKVPRADVEDFVKSLILRYQEEKFGKIIKEKKLQAHVLLYTTPLRRMLIGSIGLRGIIILASMIWRRQKSDWLMRWFGSRLLRGLRRKSSLILRRISFLVKRL
jgi:hypothetical protein